MWWNKKSKANREQEPTKDEVISYLSSSTEKDLVELLYEVFEKRPVCPDEEKWIEDKWILCSVGRDRDDEEGSWSDWELDILARDDREVYPEGWCSDVPIGQSGRTINGWTISSWAKNMICPITGNKVYGS